MIKPIVRDVFFLNQRAEEATKADLPVAQDLEDTLRANRERCVGMAANMIGFRKRIIIVSAGFANIVIRSSLKKAVHMRPKKDASLCLAKEKRSDIIRSQ